MDQPHTDAATDARPLHALLEETVARFPARPAIDFLGRRWSWAQLGRLVERAASGLRALGVERGVRVGLCLPNTPYSVILYYATLRAGGTVVNYNPLYVERELAYQIRDSGTTIMAVPDLETIYRKVADVAAASGLRHIVVCPLAGAMPRGKGFAFRLLRRRQMARLAGDPRVVRLAWLLRQETQVPPVAVDPLTDVAVLQYTGGTTGVPKGAMLTHANLTANCRQVVHHMHGVREGQEKVLGVLPLFHVFAMTAVMNFAVEVGAEMILLPRYELAQVMDCIERKRPTLFPAVPTIYAAINGAAEAAIHGAPGGRVRRDLSSIRTCISGGAPLPAEVRVRFEALTGCRLVEGYGLTEAAPVATCNPLTGDIRAGSVGLPVIGTEIEIRDPADPARLLPPGEKGEVCIRGPQVMAGYWNRPEETAQVFAEGALRTGDIGYLDADGYLFLVDRIKDVILCSGYNVYPRVLEEALYTHPAVAEAVVIGVPDAYRGQAPKAFVTLRPGRSATGEELRTYLMDHVSRIELPREVEIRESLPRTMVGKLSKKELVEEEEAAARTAA